MGPSRGFRTPDFRRLRRVGFCIAACGLASHAALQARPSLAQRREFKGYLRVIQACGPGVEARDYLLQLDGGGIMRLMLDDRGFAARGGLSAVLNRHVRVAGTPIQGYRSPGVPAVVQVREMKRDLREADGPAPATTGTLNYLSLLVRFSDAANHTVTRSTVLSMFGTARGTIPDFYHTISGELVNVTQTCPAADIAIGAFNSYQDGTAIGFNYLQATNDAFAAASANHVNLNGFNGVNLIFDRNPFKATMVGLGSIGRFNLGVGDQDIGINWTGTLPPGNPSNLPAGYYEGVLAHEIGHNTGLNHSGSVLQGAYGSNWDTMSNSISIPAGTPGYTITGQMAQQMIAFNLLSNGWLPDPKLLPVPSGHAAAIALGRLYDLTADVRAIKIPYGAAGKYYTVEYRDTGGADPYDIDLPASCFLMHTVDPSLPDQKAKVLTQNANDDPNGSGGEWLPGEQFTDAANGITVRFARLDAGNLVQVFNGVNPGAAASILTVNPGHFTHDGGTASVTVQYSGSLVSALGVDENTLTVGAGLSIGGEAPVLTDAIVTGRSSGTHQVTFDLPVPPNSGAGTLNYTLTARLLGQVGNSVTYVDQAARSNAVGVDGVGAGDPAPVVAIANFKAKKKGTATTFSAKVTATDNGPTGMKGLNTLVLTLINTAGGDPTTVFTKTIQGRKKPRVSTPIKVKVTGAAGSFTLRAVATDQANQSTTQVAGPINAP